MRTGRAHTFAGDFAVALLCPAIALLLAEVIHTALGVTRLGVLFLAAVTVVASVRGSRAGLLAAIIGVIAYKVFLGLSTTEPTTSIEDVLNVATFLVVAVVTGALAGKVRDEAAKAHEQARSMELLFNTSRTLSEGDDTNFWPAVTEAVSKGSRGMVLTSDQGGAVKHVHGELDQSAAAADFGAQILAGKIDPAELKNGQWRAKTIPSQKPFAGVLLWDAHDAANGDQKFVELVAEIASASLTRSRIRDERIRIEATEQAGKLREALLSSISHDFRSPLAAIIGSATSLLEYGNKFNKDVRNDLLLNIRDEGEKLNQFVTNMLNLTRLQAGVIKPEKREVEVADLVREAIKRLERHHGQAPRVHLEADCKVAADPLLLEQAIYNVLDNGAKYAASPRGIHVTCANQEFVSEILIRDHGPGLPVTDQAGIFTTFHFARKNGQVNGTGLGLSISRGFIEAMGGTIAARDPTDGEPGLELVITLPRSQA